MNHCLYWRPLPSLPHLSQILKPSSAHSPMKERPRGKSLSPRRRQGSPQRRACRRDKSWVFLPPSLLGQTGRGWCYFAVQNFHWLIGTYRKTAPGALVPREAPEAAGTADVLALLCFLLLPQCRVLGLCRQWKSTLVFPKWHHLSCILWC